MSFGYSALGFQIDVTNDLPVRTNLICWLDASDHNFLVAEEAPPLESGDHVASWVDKSRSATTNTFSQATTTDQPVITFEGYGGLTKITFDGSDDVLTTPDNITEVIGTNPRTFIFCLKFISSNKSFFTLNHGAGGSGGTYLLTLELAIRTGGGRTLVGSDTVTSTLHTCVYRQGTFSALSSADMRLDGTATSPSVSNDGSVNTTNDGTTRLGQGNTNVWTNFDLVEMAIYNRALTNSEIEKVERYYQIKWKF